MKAPLVLLTALFIASAHQNLSGETSGDWTYSVSDNQATITGYSGAGGAVDIPAVVNDISVVKVGNGWPAIFGNGNTTVTSVTIPNGVTSIGEDAFFNCISLDSVTIGNSVTSIGDTAFGYCTSLASITIPDSVTSIGEYVFLGCTSLASITIPDSVTSMGNYAFESCTSLTSVTLPATLFVEGNYSDYSLLAEQVRVEKTSIDAFVVNAETAARASGARTIVNVSARVTLGSGQMVTPGFVVRDVPTKLLIRAVGPRLGDFGVNYLPNPRMTIFDASQNVVRTIDDWKSDNSVSELSDLMTATASAGAFPLEQDTSSAATLVTLDPGVYTVQVDSADEGVGDVLVEVYEISE